MKTGYIGFLAGLATGVVAAILFTPLSGKTVRKVLFSSDTNAGDWQNRDTYNIHELMTNNSTSLEELKLRIRNADAV